jgi:hypothetical protein
MGVLYVVIKMGNNKKNNNMDKRKGFFNYNKNKN